MSGLAAFPRFNLIFCLDTPETDVRIFCIDGELSFLGSTSSTRCRSFRGTRLMKTDWNWAFVSWKCVIYAIRL